jgi:hypothetical protein
MDVSLLKLKAIFRQAAGRKGTLLAQALRRRDARDAKCVGATVPDRSERSESSGEPVRVREHSALARRGFGQEPDLCDVP